jgi:cytochrome c2
MPNLLHQADEGGIGDIVAFLQSLRDPKDDSSSTNTSSGSNEPTPGESGSILFERLGCIGCHTLSPVDPHADFDRISLAYAKLKYQPGQLKQFLQAPHKHHSGSHMPDFRLSDSESATLAAFIKQSWKGTGSASTAALNGDPERGKKLFNMHQCNQCHQSNFDKELRSITVPIKTRDFNQRGKCLDIAMAPRRTAPIFHLDEHQRSALTAYLKRSEAERRALTEDVSSRLARSLTSLRCNVCHSRDTSNPILPEIVAEEGSGKLPDPIPHLTWVGEKLQGPWVAKFIKGEIAHKPRTWLASRMPAFPEYADLLAHDMATEHGVPFEESSLNPLDLAKVETGRRLTLRDGGLDCRQCHGVGKELPRGDTATQIALGINFAMTKSRLRPEFAMRQLLDPPRYDFGSRMPRFAPDLQMTTARNIEGGNAKKQFEAIKHYLWSIKDEQ